MPEWVLFRYETAHRSHLISEKHCIIWEVGDNQLKVSLNHNQIHGQWTKGGIFETITLPSCHQFRLWAHLQNNVFTIGIKGQWEQWSNDDWRIVVHLWNRHQQYRNDMLLPEHLSAQRPDEDWYFIWDQCSTLFQWNTNDRTRTVDWVFSSETRLKTSICWILQKHKPYNLQFITSMKYANICLGKPILETNLLMKKIQKIPDEVNTIVWISDSFSLAQSIELPSQIKNIIFVYTKKSLWKILFQSYRRKWWTLKNSIYEKYPYLLDCNPHLWDHVHKHVHQNPEPLENTLEQMEIHPWFHNILLQHPVGSLQRELICWGISHELQHKYSLLCMDVHREDWAPKWEHLECPITLENNRDVNYIEWPCGHILEESAHWKHLASHRHPTCPLCRTAPAQKQLWRRILSDKTTKNTFSFIDLFGPLTAICWKTMDHAVETNTSLQVILPPAPLNGMILQQWKKWRQLWNKHGIRKYRNEREMCPILVDLRNSNYQPIWKWEDIHTKIRIDTVPEQGWEETLDMTFFT